MVVIVEAKDLRADAVAKTIGEVHLADLHVRFSEIVDRADTIILRRGGSERYLKRRNGSLEETPAQAA